MSKDGLGPGDRRGHGSDPDPAATPSMSRNFDMPPLDLDWDRALETPQDQHWPLEPTASQAAQALNPLTDRALLQHESTFTLSQPWFGDSSAWYSLPSEDFQTTSALDRTASTYQFSPASIQQFYQPEINFNSLPPRAEGNGAWEDLSSPSLFNTPFPIPAVDSNDAHSFANRSPSPASSYGSNTSGASYPPRKKVSAKGPEKRPVQMSYSEFAGKKKGGSVGKRVRRRKGPLLPEQRKQASEIRKLHACLRCKFLKKTCDKGDPCGGCLPSHARLWQVPCTRLDIKDLGYFLKDLPADFDPRTPNISINNIKGFSPREVPVFITHGYGHVFSVTVREVFATDDSTFSVSWVEPTSPNNEPTDFEMCTDKFDVDIDGYLDGIRRASLSLYLDRHIDGSFEDVIDKLFEHSLFIPEILKVTHRYYVKTESEAVRRAFKLLLAYHFTMSITTIEGGNEILHCRIDDEESRFHGCTIVPSMVNRKINTALADMWRELHKEVMEDLSTFYAGVYSGEKLKNWFPIFAISSILFIVWEKMQFDYRYRAADLAAVDKFCTEMEATPLGALAGLFQAISQKVPDFTEWETLKHSSLFRDPSIYEAMTELRQHVTKHEAYLRTRQDAEFDRGNFYSLSNKFLSKLVIRPS